MVNDYGRPSSVIIKMWRLVLVTNWTRTVSYQRKGPNSYSFLMSLSDGPMILPTERTEISLLSDAFE